MRYKKYKMSKCEDCGEDTLDEFGHCVSCCECKECLKALEEAQVLKDSMDPTSEYWLPPRCQNCSQECEACMKAPMEMTHMEMRLLEEIKKLQQLCEKQNSTIQLLSENC